MIDFHDGERGEGAGTGGGGLGRANSRGPQTTWTGGKAGAAVELGSDTPGAKPKYKTGATMKVLRKWHGNLFSFCLVSERYLLRSSRRWHRVLQSWGAGGENAALVVRVVPR